MISKACSLHVVVRKGTPTNRRQLVIPLLAEVDLNSKMKYRSSLNFSSLLPVLQQRSKLRRSRQLCASLSRQLYDFHLNCKSDLQSIVKVKFNPGASVNIRNPALQLWTGRAAINKYKVFITSKLVSSLLPTLKQCLLISWRHMAWLSCLCKDHSAFP